jgi:hypothetical protein
MLARCTASRAALGVFQIGLAYYFVAHGIAVLPALEASVLLRVRGGRRARSDAKNRMSAVAERAPQT